MNRLHYGGGNCSIEGNISSVVISYRGAIVIDSKLPEGYTITLGKWKLEINTILNKINLGELFTYYGELYITHAHGYNIENEYSTVHIKRQMDITELIATKSEDMTQLSEKMNVTYIHKRTFSTSRVLPKVLEGLHTDSIEVDIYHPPQKRGDIGETYTGYFHLHNNGTIMSGAVHAKDSRKLLWRIRT